MLTLLSRLICAFVGFVAIGMALLYIIELGQL
jgi:hypothetical protein